ncbi:hypothetical protein BCR37DRAFT_385317 [Protomyces lactucae-debilis]|uniref:Uncharacterized protein n=1 Tax=Protomyces lactucae-debilis TaxID=2754530 RepID=A0A1Y2FTD1_PROLT|nr:uncharacterized protein BCR37DRAFT_385317 [Protomyces lactucae-debilis]ORY86847.1 hypothetical protein BCR37DRAFT_385317 [Protomyces lactucae-debilis]
MPQRSLSNTSDASLASMHSHAPAIAPIAPAGRSRVRRQPSRSALSASQPQLSSFSISGGMAETRDAMGGCDPLVVNLKQAIQVWDGLKIPQASPATGTTAEPVGGISIEEETAMRESEEIRRMLSQYRHDQQQQQQAYRASHRSGASRQGNAGKDLFDDSDWDNLTVAGMVRGVMLDRSRRELERDAWIFE